MKLPVASSQLSVAPRESERHPRIGASLTTDNWQLATPRAFSLTELLVVIGLLALLLTLSIPAFRFITGSRQTDAAYNVVSAVLGQARAEAIGLQEKRGVFFYRQNGRIFANQIQATPRNTLDDAEVTFYDLVPDHEAVGFPNKVGVQTLNNGIYTSSGPLRRKSFDRYIGFNDGGGVLPVDFGGVILFDGNGQLICENYGFRCVTRDATNAVDTYTAMGRLLRGKVVAETPVSTEGDYLPVAKFVGGNENPFCLRSQLGFVLFDEVLSETATFAEKNQDLQVNNSGTVYVGSDEQTRESWLDANASPWVINRFNGSLLKGE